MMQVRFEETMSQNCRKHVQDQPNDMIVSNMLRDQIARSDGRKKDSNQETNPFQWPLLSKLKGRSECCGGKSWWNVFFLAGESSEC